MTEPQAATGPSTGQMGLVPRFLAAFFSPGRLFAQLAGRPVWFWMAVLTGVLGGLLNLLVFSTEAGETAFRQQLQDSGQLPPEGQIGTVIAVTRIITTAAAVVLTPVFALVVAGVAYLIFNVILGGEGSYRQALAIVSHVFPIGILQGILRTVLILQKETFQASTNLAAFAPFLDDDSSILLLLKGIDPFWIWQVGLLALGMSVIHRQPARKCATVLFSIYAVILLVVVLIARLIA